MIAGWDALVLLIVTMGTRRTLAGCSVSTPSRAASGLPLPPSCLLPQPGLGRVVLVALLLVVVPVT